jgi:hypothetical protein
VQSPLPFYIACTARPLLGKAWEGGLVAWVCWRPMPSPERIWQQLMDTPSSGGTATSTKSEERIVPESKSPAPQVPPEVTRYLKGVAPEGKQFDFLIGDWHVAATRYKEDGSTLFQYKASWNAKYLNEERMVVDDFKAHAPTGQAVSSYVTLRTYSEATRRWEMAGLSALEPASSAQWHGELQDGEMLLDASGKDPAGNMVKTKIRFFNIAKNSFSWESKVSRDEGKTWVKTASLLVSRVAQ